MMTVFAEEEMILLASGNNESRTSAIAWLKEIHHTVEDDSDMKELIENVISKLVDMTDEEYLKIDFSEYAGWMKDIQNEIDQEISAIPDDGAA